MSVVGIQLGILINGQDGKLVMRKFSAALERAGAEVTDFAKHIFPKLTPVLEDAEARQFASEGASGSAGAWAPLSRVYGEWKAKHFPGAPILVRTGDLRSSLVDSSSPHALRRTTPTSFVFGTVLEYGQFHQTGTRNMPARAPIDFDPEFEEDLQKALQLGVIEAIREGMEG